MPNRDERRRSAKADAGALECAELIEDVLAYLETAAAVDPPLSGATLILSSGEMMYFPCPTPVKGPAQ